MKPIIAHPEADEEFQYEIDYYESQEEGLGARFRAAVEFAAERIRAQPSFFPIYEATPCRECPVRRFPFAIYYLEQPDYIWVVAFANQRRRPGYWLNRLRRR